MTPPSRQEVAISSENTLSLTKLFESSGCPPAPPVVLIPPKSPERVPAGRRHRWWDNFAPADRAPNMHVWPPSRKASVAADTNQEMARIQNRQNRARFSSERITRVFDTQPLGRRASLLPVAPCFTTPTIDDTPQEADSSPTVDPQIRTLDPITPMPIRRHRVPVREMLR